MAIHGPTAIFLCELHLGKGYIQQRIHSTNEDFEGRVDEQGGDNGWKVQATSLGSGGSVVASLLAKIERLEQENRRLRTRSERFRILATKKTDIDQAKSDLLTLVAHELRTPVSAILGAADLLDTLTTEEDRTSFLAIIRDETLRLTATFDRICDLVAARSGAMQFSLEPCSLPDLLEAALGQVRSVAEERSVITTTDLFPVQVNADKDHMTAAFREILANAIRHSPEGGVVTVAMESGEGESVSVRIRDQGPGIPPEAVSKILSGFSSLEPMDNHTRGMGVGLFLAHHVIVVGHGGHLEITTPAEGGTEVRICLSERGTE